MKRIITALGAVAAILAGVLSAAPAAHATVPSGLCGGSLIDTYSVNTSSGTRYATIYLYYSSASGGTNCAILHKDAWHNVKRNDMFIGISLCGSPGCVNYNYSQSDHSLDNPTKGYLHYAGPVVARYADSRCVFLSAHMWSGATDTGTKASRVVTGTHCG